MIEADLDVGSLAARLEAGGQRRFSLCLQGPPGSGKSAYVRHLADRIGLEVMHKRMSDLLSMWVGGTEKQIAGAFAEARDNQAFLVFDEADSLLADRRGAHRGWEVSQVNEMLTWMESHPLPFACTTNFGENLDSAALRRFVFKVPLGFLKPEAAASAFRTFFGLEPPIGLGALSVLTPGDFEVVRRKAGFGIGSRIESVVFMVVIGIASNAAPLVGQNWGARRFDRVDEALRLCYRYCLVWGVIAAVIMWTGGELFVTLIRDEAEVVATATAYLYIIPITIGFAGMFNTANGAFNALSKPLPPLVLSLLRLLVFYIPLALLARQWLGHVGIFAAAAFTNVVLGLWARDWNRRTVIWQRRRLVGTSSIKPRKPAGQ